MKKLLSFMLMFFFIGGVINAQESTFAKGDMVINAGVGFGWYSYGFGAKSLPAISLSLEKGIKDIDFGTLSVGGIVGFKHATYSWNSAYDDYSWTDFIVAARGAIHANILDVDKLDTYGG